MSRESTRTQPSDRPNNPDIPNNRIATIPDNFAQWPEDAQRAFLEDGRLLYEIFDCIIHELGLSDEVAVGANGDTKKITKVEMIDLYLAVRAGKHHA